MAGMRDLDAKSDAEVAAAAKRFYSDNCVEEEPGKFRCPLSMKLFKDAVFVHKHIDNKHADKLAAAKRQALEPKYGRRLATRASDLATRAPSLAAEQSPAIAERGHPSALPLPVPVTPCPSPNAAVYPYLSPRATVTPPQVRARLRARGGAKLRDALAAAAAEALLAGGRASWGAPGLV